MASDNVHSYGSEKTEWTSGSYQHSPAERAKRRGRIHARFVAILPIRHLTGRIVPSRFVDSWRYICGLHVTPVPAANSEGWASGSSRWASSRSHGVEVDCTY